GTSNHVSTAFRSTSIFGDHHFNDGSISSVPERWGIKSGPLKLFCSYRDGEYFQDKIKLGCNLRSHAIAGLLVRSLPSKVKTGYVRS
ncbi:unnamed protein product, partial [Dovyalis caffra]